MKDEILRIKERINEEKIIECQALKIPRCWVCKDDGLVYYSKEIEIGRAHV